MSISTMLFVCTGNTCRSPMPEGIAQYLLQKKGLLEWQACSAGIFAVDGADTSQLAIKALGNRGIQFEGSSKSLNTKMIMEST